MARVTTEISAKSNMKAGITQAKADMKAFRKAVQQEQKAARAEAKNAGGGGGMMGAITKGNLLAMGISKVAQAAGDAAENVGELQDISEQLGVSAESVGRLERVMEGSGVKAENVRKAFMSLNEAQTAVKNGNADMTGKFAELGISASEVTSLPVDKLFFRVADGMAAMSDQGKAASLGMDMIGTKNARMIGVMKGGGAEIQASMKNVTNVVNDAANKALDDTLDSAKTKTSEFKGMLGNMMGGAVLNAGRSFSAIGSLFDDKKDPDEKSDVSIIGSGAINAVRTAIAGAKAAVAADKRNKNIAAANAEIAHAEKMEEAGERQAENEKELREIQKEKLKDAEANLTLKERESLILARMSSLRGERKNGMEDHEFQVKNANLQGELDAIREKKIARQAMDPRERAEADRQERKARRRMDQAKRVVAGHDREKIEAKFKRGEMTDEERKEQLKALRAEKNAVVSTPEAQLLTEIKGFMEKMAQQVGVAG